MLRHGALLWVLFAAIMGFFVGGSFVSAFSAPQLAQQEDAAANKDHTNKQSIEERHQATEEAIAYYNKWLMFFTAILAVSTIVLGVATVMLWLSSEKQFAALNRPHIIVHAVEFKRFPGTDQYDFAGASLLCFNKGNTAAVDVQARGDILVSYDPPVVDMQRKLIKSVSELVSGQKLRVELTSGRPVRELTAFLTDRPGLKATNPTMYCVGTVSYRDQNGMRRETGYCFLLKPSLLRWVSAESPEHEYAY